MSTQRNILIQPAINSIDNKKPSSSKPWQSDDAIVSISWLGFKVFCQSGGATGSLWTIGLVAAMFVVSEIVFVGCDVIVAGMERRHGGRGSEHNQYQRQRY